MAENEPTFPMSGIMKSKPRNTRNTRISPCDSQSRRPSDSCAPFRVFRLFRGFRRLSGLRLGSAAGKCFAFAAMILCLGAGTSSAQWKTETFQLQAGWNAIFTHVDAAYTEVGNLFAGTPVTEVWLWKPDFTSRQFINEPDEPLDTGSNWSFWKASDPVNSTLTRFIGHKAYLVRATAATTLSIKGIPVPPIYEWTSSGQNFFGFSTPSATAPNLDDFLVSEPTLQLESEIFGYVGGSTVTDALARIVARRSTPVTRGRAFWLRGPNPNNYTQPFDLNLSNTRGIDFGRTSAEYSLQLINRHRQALEVTIELLPSESAPSNVTIAKNATAQLDYSSPIKALPPVLVRGAQGEDGNYAVIPLNNSPQTISLAASGSEGSGQRVVVGINLPALQDANAGDVFGGIVRFTDHLGLSQVDVPLRYEQNSKQGLWVGQANVTHVEDSVTDADNPTQGIVSTTFPLRIILFSDSAGKTWLLQRAYYGLDQDTNSVFALSENFLAPQFLGSARRISAVHLPWTAANSPWEFSGDFREGGTLTTTISVGHDDHASNPFLHTFHPDHDNKNAFFDAKLPRGEESFDIERTVRLSLNSIATGFVDLVQDGVHRLSGSYEEEVSVRGKNAADARTVKVTGFFSIIHLSGSDTGGQFALRGAVTPP